MRSAEVLDNALREHLQSRMVPFMKRFGFAQSDDAFTFKKDDRFVRVVPSSYDPTDFPWMLDLVIGKAGTETAVHSKDREPYYTRTTEDIAGTVERMLDDLEDQHMSFLKD